MERVNPSLTMPIVKENVVLDFTQIKKPYVYKIGKQIQSGGFGEVFEAIREPDGKRIAVKAIPQTKSIQKMKAQGMIIPKEVHYLSEVTGLRGVLGLVDWYEDELQLIIMMETPKNSVDLHTYITENTYIIEPIAQELFYQIVLTVQQIFSGGIFHRDLKSENIIIENDGDKVIPYIIDFGCATFYLPNMVYTSLNGTLADYPPEYRTKNKYTAVGHAVWNLGCLLFEMTTGNAKFDKNGQADKTFKYDANVSKPLRQLIAWCLEEDESKRASLNSILKHKWLSRQTARH